MTSATCRCPKTASVLLAPLTLVLLVIDVMAWGQQAWIDQHNRAPETGVIYCLAFALAGPAVIICTLRRWTPQPRSRWRQLLQVEERTLIVVAPAFVLLLMAIAAAAVI